MSSIRGDQPYIRQLPPALARAKQVAPDPMQIPILAGPRPTTLPTQEQFAAIRKQLDMGTIRGGSQVQAAEKAIKTDPQDSSSGFEKIGRFFTCLAIGFSPDRVISVLPYKNPGKVGIDPNNNITPPGTPPSS